MTFPQDDNDNDTAIMSDIPIESENASSSLSFADVNLMEKGGRSSSNNLVDATETLHDVSENSASLPTTEEIRAAVHPEPSHRRSRKCVWCSVAFLLVVVAVVLGISIPVARQASETSLEQNSGASSSGGSHSDAPPAPAPADDTTSTTNKRATRDETIAYLTQHAVSDTAALQTTGTPQSLAADWMAELDGLALPLPAGDLSSDEGYEFLFRYVMAVTYFSFNGPDWAFQSEFLTDVDVCQWNGITPEIGSFQGFERGGVTCDADTGLPVVLDLEYNNLSGTIPTELGLLSTIVYLDLEYNLEIEGQIPSELCQLTDLRYLSLKANKIQGELPSCMSNWQELEVLDLLNNELSGEIPQDLCGMDNMQLFVADKNFFSGELPACISSWTNLLVLSASDNQFIGSLPDLSKLTQLQEIYIDGNFLEGNPTSVIAKLEQLELLYIEQNKFTGDIANFAVGLDNLVALDISSNSFTSTEYGIPPHMLQLPNLSILDLSGNQLKGNIPTDIATQANLRFLSVHENEMTGGIPSELKNLTGLLHLDLSNNGFHGPLRDQLFEMPSLAHLFLGENPLLHAGSIPSTLAQATQLTELSLKNTNRTGPLPELANFTQLFLLDLDNNQFSGTIPSNYGKLPVLRHLLLNRNPLTGTLPNFTDTGILGTVLLDGTGLTGDFSTICNLPAFKGEVELAGNVIAVADCGDDDSPITCDCCHCCFADDNDGSCSEPLVASLDWTWEYGFRRTSRDFAINVSLLEPPLIPIPDP
jgi:Leucine-rich repeat (LRR) protein